MVEGGFNCLRIVSSGEDWYGDMKPSGSATRELARYFSSVIYFVR